MKMGNTTSFKIILIAAMLMLGSRSQAYFTSYLDAVSNALTTTFVELTNNPTPTRAERQQIVAIGKALKTLAKPSTSVAGDYSLFLAATTQLGPIAQTPEFLMLGTNVFTAFTNDARVQIITTGDRVAALSRFVVTRRAASNALNQAQRTLDRIPSITDLGRILAAGRQVFTKISVAKRLVEIGEAKPGFAPNGLAGTSLTHSNRADAGVVSFIDGNNYSEADDGGSPENGTYTYDRTGLNTATLVLTKNEGTPDEDVTTVRLVFTAANRGKFSARNVSSGGTDTSAGTFTIP